MMQRCRDLFVLTRFFVSSLRRSAGWPTCRWLFFAVQLPCCPMSCITLSKIFLPDD